MWFKDNQLKVGIYQAQVAKQMEVCECWTKKVTAHTGGGASTAEPLSVLPLFSCNLKRTLVFVNICRLNDHVVKVLYQFYLQIGLQFIKITAYNSKVTFLLTIILV